MGAVKTQLLKYYSQGVVAFDYETTGLNYFTDRIIGFSLSTKDAADYFWLDELDSEDVDVFAEILRNAHIKKLCWNAKFEMHFSKEAGYELNNVDDVMIMAVLSDENVKHGLKDQAKMHIDDKADELRTRVIKALELEGYDAKHFEIGKLMQIKKYRPLIAEYGRLDAWYTYKLWEYYKDEIEKLYKGVYTTEQELIPVVVQMERTGILIDKEFLEKQMKELTIEADALESALRSWIRENADESFTNIELNLESDSQIAEMLTEGFHIQLPSTPKGRLKTDKYTLENIQDQWPKAKDFLYYRQLRKVVSTYCKNILERLHEGRIHCDFWQNGARTGRFSSSNPNLQNQPNGVGDIRKAFLCDPDYSWFCFDFDQMELRIMTHYSKDEGLIDAVKRGEDLHSYVAKKLYKTKTVTEEQRKAGKTINFGLGYGMGAPAFSKKLGVGIEKAREFIDWYFQLFPKVKQLMRSCQDKIYEDGHIRNMFGRCRRLERDDARKAFNALIQSCSADMIKRKLVEVAKLLEGKKSKIILTIHDEIDILIHTNEMHLVKEIKDCMENWKGILDVPITVSVKHSSTNWGSLKEYSMTFDKEYDKYQKIQKPAIDYHFLDLHYKPICGAEVAEVFIPPHDAAVQCKCCWAKARSSGIL